MGRVAIISGSQLTKHGFWNWLQVSNGACVRSGGAQHQIKRGQFSIATESNGRLARSGQLVFGPPCVDTIVGKAIRNEALDLFIFSK